MTQVLISWVVRTGAIILGGVTLLVFFLLGREHAVGVIVGGGLALADGIAIVYLSGQLLEPGTQTSKPALMFLLLFKLAIVGALLWASLVLWGVSGLGIIVGIGSALFALVFGVSRGSSSPEGKRAMEAAEAKIREEMANQDPAGDRKQDLEDTESDSG